jgi:hypothetical protein
MSCMIHASNRQTDAADSFVLSEPPSGIGDKCTLRKKLSVVIGLISFFISFSGSIVLVIYLLTDVCHLPTFIFW